jgi:hypothetical protein
VLKVFITYAAGAAAVDAHALCNAVPQVRVLLQLGATQVARVEGRRSYFARTVGADALKMDRLLQGTKLAKLAARAVQQKAGPAVPVADGASAPECHQLHVTNIK